MKIMKLNCLWHVALLPVLLFLSGCVKEPSFQHERGSQIVFRASTQWTNENGTRTEYSGKDENGNSVYAGSSYERIDWKPGYDRVRILCEAAESGPMADYAVTGSATVVNQKSTAGIDPVADGADLQWGTGDHYFYALYPAPGMESNYAFTDNNPVMEEIAKIERADGNKALVTGFIPDRQEVVKVGNVFKPNMNYAYMYAATKVQADAEGDVTLSFQPLVTTLEFTITGVSDSSGKLVYAYLSSSTTPLCGTFTATLSTEENPVIDLGYTSNQIRITLPDGGVQLSATDPVTFTFLTLPVDQTDLILTLYIQTNGGSIKYHDLYLKVDGSAITVPACKKGYFRPLGVPESWDYYFGSLRSVELNYAGGDGSLASSFVSYKTNGSSSIAVPFTFEYSENFSTWSTTPPSWFTPPTPDSGGEYTGSTTGRLLDVTLAPQENRAIDEHQVTLAAKTPVVDFDLSTLNVATGETVNRTTANCYVVQAPGTYKFPLVYGNGVKNGSVNESAYRGKAGVDATEYRPDDGELYPPAPAYYSIKPYYLGSFKDHLDNNIYNGGDATSSPYLTTHLNKSASDFTPILVWQDLPGLVEVDATISGTGENAYFTFSIPKENINQGNALVAVLVDGVIAWSWHIWVTDEDLSAVKEGSNGNYFAPVNIGWCDGRVMEDYAKRSFYVRAVQAESGKTAYATVTQNGRYSGIGNNCPFYQWGRKDPLQALDGLYHSPSSWHGSQNLKPYYSSSSTYVPLRLIQGRVTIGTSIQTPYIFYDCNDGDFANGNDDWCSSLYINRWSSTMNGIRYERQNADGKTKTIYDPSPVGFRVPALDAFSDFNRGNSIYSEVTHKYPNSSTIIWQDKGRTYTPSGLYFPYAGYIAEAFYVWSYGAGYYQTSIPYNDSAEFYQFWVSSNSFSADNGAADSCVSLRPVRE